MMKNRVYATLDGNEAVARTAFKLNEVAAIYPITPSSPMGEWADDWSAKGKKNIWGSIPLVMEMQSEGGAAGAAHGALQTGSLTTTFTCSQGLMLMLPNMYKIAGELTPTVFHIAARALATSALSIFGDHSDVMAARMTGFAMLSAASVQESHDFAAIAQAATLESRIPFIHFFDGFRTSHEVAKIELLQDEELRQLIDDKYVHAHRERALSPDHPVLRGTAQNPDTFFQLREAVNSYYEKCPDITARAMETFAKATGRNYGLYEYIGAPDAENVVILMGSGCEVVEETVKHLNALGSKLGMLKVRLYRPFDIKRFVEVLPASTKTIAVLDRTKEPGATGEPLYLDCLSAISEGLQNGLCKFKAMPRIVAGRYGLSSKEFTPAMVKAIYENLSLPTPKNHFTIGINDDVTGTSLSYDASFSIESDKVVRALFYGLGADGTVGANKDSIKILGEDGESFAQGYFVYDSKKSGAMTVSHLRFGPEPIRAPYLVTRANFIACHQPAFIDRYDMLNALVEGGTFLLNSPFSADEVWNTLLRPVQQMLLSKKAKFYVINAHKLARDIGISGRINTIMQACFFALSGVMPRAEAIEKIKKATVKSYGKKGEKIVAMNIAAIEQAVDNLHEVKVPSAVSSAKEMPQSVSGKAPGFVREVLGEIIGGRGDDLPVSAMPADGTYPTATAKWEKRNIAESIPVWNSDACIQCGKCVMVCPHSSIRMKVYEPGFLEKAPASFKSMDARDAEWKGQKFTIQVAPEDCTGCGVCADACPTKSKPEDKRALNLKPQMPLREQEVANWDFYLSLPSPDRRKLDLNKVRSQQFQEPLFEFSGACSGCGSSPYLKLLSQLYGDRALIANATGCTSIYCGNMPTTPWTKNADGRGPAWCNSLFEDNAEFGVGFSLSVEKQKEFAAELLKSVAPQVGDSFVNAILTAQQDDESGIFDQRQRIAELKNKLQTLNSPEAGHLLRVADMLVKKSIWIIGGDGWAYDIGFGGLDHTLASGKNVNILVVDTEAYSNTGGQMSKSTPRGAVAKFASGGKSAAKKDLGLIAMSYGNVYVACVAMGARDEHTLQVLREAESYPGTSLIIAYAPCIVHGIDMQTMLQRQKAIVDSGRWILYRFDPRRSEKGENPLLLDSKPGKIPVSEFMYAENRFAMLAKSNPEEAKRLLVLAQEDVDARQRLYNHMASGNYSAK